MTPPGAVLEEFDHQGHRIRLRTWRPGDEVGLVECFNAVFPVDDPRVPQQTLAEWAWKFDDRPTGRREIVLAEHDAVGVIGAYPSQPLRMWCEGAEIRASQVVDLMVRHEFRRAGPRPGLFVQMGRAFNRTFCGRGPGVQNVHYGWPVPAWRIGQRYLDYINVRDWNFLAREIKADETRRAVPVGLRVTRVARFGTDVDHLFARLRDGFGLTTVREASYLNWRYADHPRRAYELLEVRSADGALRAVAVYGVGDFLRPHTSHLVDWLVDSSDDEALLAIVAACEARCVRDATGAIAGVLSPIDPRFMFLQKLGYLVWDTGYYLSAVPFRYDTGFLRQNWIFTMGDSDLV